MIADPIMINRIHPDPIAGGCPKRAWPHIPLKDKFVCTTVKSASPNGSRFVVQSCANRRSVFVQECTEYKGEPRKYLPSTFISTCKGWLVVLQLSWRLWGGRRSSLYCYILESRNAVEQGSMTIPQSRHPILHQGCCVRNRQ